MADDIDAHEARNRIQQGAFLLDVREDLEWNAGHAPEAKHVPLGALTRSLDSLPNDCEIVVVCKVGGRSSQAAAFLQQQGFNSVNLDGGMLAWASAGFPIVDEQGNEGVVI